MISLIGKLFGFRSPDEGMCRPSATDFLATQDAARQMSEHRDNRDDVIVVVEMGAEFDSANCTYVSHRYNFYTYRGRGDFHGLYNLKAAYVNGRRVDVLDKANCGRLIVHRAPAVMPEVEIPAGDPIGWGGRTPAREYSTPERRAA